MALGEFNLIERYFSRQAGRDDVALAVGDDAALLRPKPGQALVVSVDTLLSGVHFPESTAPADIGYKALAVNLSDLAAMGAEPAWVTLALTLPEADPDWLAGFSAGFFELAQRHDVALVGGDTCHGPLSVTVQIMGWAPPEQTLKRSGARVGDGIYVTGCIGDAGLGLRLAQGGIEPVEGDDYFIRRLNRPTPRIGAGLALRGIASAAIDVSDGLAADLGHILDQSGVAAVIDVAALPVASRLKAQAPSRWWQWPLTAGDDYELCFTVAAANEARLSAALGEIDCPFTRIGEIEAGRGLSLRLEDGRRLEMNSQGYRHFE